MVAKLEKMINQYSLYNSNSSWFSLYNSNLYNWKSSVTRVNPFLIPISSQLDILILHYISLLSVKVEETQIHFDAIIMT